MEAVAALDQQRFDLVLMDVQMPNMDGIEATRIIREKEHTVDRHTPIVAMTAGAMKGDEEHCLEAGMDGYVSKPINPEKLYEIMEKCVGQMIIGPSIVPAGDAVDRVDKNVTPPDATPPDATPPLMPLPLMPLPLMPVRLMPMPRTRVRSPSFPT